MKHHERCCECVEFYHACTGQPEGIDLHCADFHPLPDAGVGGKTGQRLPASRMRGRTGPRIMRDPVIESGKPARRAPSSPTGPKAVYGADGVRRCACGAAIPARKRCCNECREVRRQETMKRRRMPTGMAQGMPVEATSSRCSGRAQF